MKAYYQIDGDNNIFRTLKEAKYHVWIAYTQKERVKYLSDTYITKVVGEEVVTITKIKVNNESYSFGKTIKL